MNATLVDTAAPVLFDFVSEHEGLHRKKPSSTLINSYCDPASPMGRALQADGLWTAYLYKGYEPTKKYTSLSGTPWTIGFGSTGADVGPGTVWTLDQVKGRYVTQSAGFMRGVLAALGAVKVTANQLAALTSLAYNIGLAAFKSSTLLKLLLAGNVQGAADQFPRWNKAQGKVMPGLTKRRDAERALFLRKDAA